VSKPTSSKKWICAFSIVPLLAFVFVAVLICLSARHHVSASASSAVLPTSQPQTIAPAMQARIRSTLATLPLSFEQNEGQTDDVVKYAARANGYTLFLTSNGAVFSLHSPLSGSSAAGRPAAFRSRMSTGQLPSLRNPKKSSSAVVRVQLVGANSSPAIASSDELPGKSNYFIGSDSEKWRSNVPRYARVSYQNVYPGVDMAFHGERRHLEFDFIVAPGATPQPIAFHFTGAQRIKTDDSGNLVIASTAGDVLLHKPIAYQQQNGARRAVDARFVLKARNRVSFELGSYDRSRELVIDPSVTVAYSTYLGGSLEDDGYGIAIDTSGNAYITGKTDSTDFPTLGGVLPNTNAGGFDVFVTKIAPTGSSLVYSTYVGGTAGDSGNAIAVDAFGDAFVTGGTASTDFPTTHGAFQTTYGTSAAQNAFVFELDPAGNALTYSTFLGGTVDDLGYGIALDSSGNAFAVGVTSSPDFPTTLNPLQTYPGGDNNGFVTKLNSSGSALVYSTYLNLGGAIGDAVNAVALDSSGNAYVTGAASSSSFHTTAGAFQTQCGTDGTCNGGLSDAFVTVITATGSNYVYSTFLGGSSSDLGNGIAVDASSNAYVTGSTSSSDFPLKSAVQSIYGGNTDAFVTKLNSTGSALVYSTYLGGSQFDAGAGIAVDSGGNAYVTGQTDSPAPSPFSGASATQPTIGGGYDAFVSEINSAGSKLPFSTYLGGLGNEDSSSGKYGAIAVDNAGANIYVTGDTASTNFPTASPLYSSYAGGAFDAFLVEYAQPSFSISATTPAAVSPGSSATSTVTLTSLNGYSSPVNLTCTVTGAGSPLPACSATSFATNPLTPTSGGVTTTLTITTTGSSGAIFRPKNFYYAMWLPITGLSLFVGVIFSSSRARRKTLFGFVIIGAAGAGLLLMPACGGSSSSGGGTTSCASAPSAPTGLAASNTTTTGTTLNWTAAAVGANCSVTGYTVYENGKSIGTATSTTFNVTGLTAATKYSFTVAASDSAGLSAQSSAASVTTLSSATPAGAYTVTITGTGTDANQTTQSYVLTVTVN
jgi:Beta-propeller repeat/Fibronectin type III domain